MNAPRRGQCPCCVGLVSQSDDGEPSIVAHKIATSLAAPFVELVFRESQFESTPQNGVAESAMREVKSRHERKKVLWKRIWERSLSPTPS